MKLKQNNKQTYLNFDDFWLKKSSQQKLDSGLKQAIAKHFKARGFDKPELYDLGWKDFGFKN